MSESFFRNTLGARARRAGDRAACGAAKLQGAENSGVATAQSAARQDDRAAGCGGDRAERGGTGAGKEIYDDVSVCRALGIRRRVLAAARVRPARGADWDALDEHAGMTRAWIGRKAEETNVAVDWGSLKRIEVGDGVVSVRLIGFHSNPCVCIVEAVVTQKRGFARVRNIYDYPIYPGECFDCRRIGCNLEWVANLNEVKY